MFRYGPPATLGPDLAAARVETRDYRNYLLELNSAIIDDNRMVVEANSRRFRRSLLSMLLGIANVAAGTVVSLLPPRQPLQLAVVGTAGATNLTLIAYVEREGFLTLERQRPVPQHE